MFAVMRLAATNGRTRGSAVATATKRSQARLVVSPWGVAPSLKAPHRVLFSQTAERRRSSLVGMFLLFIPAGCNAGGGPVTEPIPKEFSLKLTLLTPGTPVNAMT